MVARRPMARDEHMLFTQPSVRIDVASGQSVAWFGRIRVRLRADLVTDSQRIAFVEHLETRSQVAGP